MLKLAPHLSLPTDAVTQTFAILAKRGVGKTYTALVMVEEMLKAQLQVVIADPIGVTWGLRAAANGKDPGLPIIVMGGEHGDVPLESTAGKVIAEFVVDSGQSVVLDLSLFRKAEQVRFMTDFAETLYHRNRAPLHLVLDEADAFAPQRPMHGQERMLGAVEDLVRRGRARGIGVTLITQRSAVLNKDVLTQVEVLVALRTIAPQDREAVDAWIKVHGTPEQREKLMASLPSLPIGTAWFWSPGWLDLFKEVKVRERETFDSSATPKIGQRPKAPKKLADVDLEHLKTQIAATIERAKAEDPKVLQMEIRRLKVELGIAAAKPALTQAVKTQTVKVPVLKDGQLSRLETVARNLAGVASMVMANVGEVVRASRQTVTHSIAPVVAGARHGEWPVITRKPPPAPTLPRREHIDKSDDGLSRVERAILTALAQHPDGLTKKQVLLHAGYAASGDVSTAFANLMRQHLTAVNGFQLVITHVGLTALGSYDPLPTGADLRDFILNGNKLSRVEKAILRVLFDAYPKSVTKGQILEQAGYKASGDVSTSFARLVRYGYALADRGALQASEDLF